MSLCVIYEDAFSAPGFHHQPILQICRQTLYVGFQRSNILSQLIFQPFSVSFVDPCKIINLVLQLESRNQWWVPAMSCVVALCRGSIVDKKLGDGEWGIYLTPIIEGFNIAFSVL